MTRARAASVLTLAVLVASATGSPAQAQCAITGRLSDPEVTLTTLSGRALGDRRRHVALEHLEVTVVPVRRGLVEITGTLPDGRAFAARSRHTPIYEVGARWDVGASDGATGLTLAAGATVRDLRPIEGTDTVELTAELGPGVTVRELVLPCRALAIRDGAPRPSDHHPPPEVAAPRLMPRARDLHVTLPDGMVARLRFEAHEEVVVFERDRREALLVVAIPLRDASVVGTVEARDVRPVTESLATRYRWYRRSRRPRGP